MKIYFAASISGGRELVKTYTEIIQIISVYGQVLTEHVGDAAITKKGESNLPAEKIYKRDIAWLNEANCVIAEITVASTGVGYEIAKAEELGKPVLCLYQKREGSSVSGMILGSKLQKYKYKEVSGIEEVIKEFIKSAS